MLVLSWDLPWGAILLLFRVSTPVKLGEADRDYRRYPYRYFGPECRMVTYTTRSANLMLQYSGFVALYPFV